LDIILIPDSPLPRTPCGSFPLASLVPAAKLLGCWLAFRILVRLLQRFCSSAARTLHSRPLPVLYPCTCRRAQRPKGRMGCTASRATCQSSTLWNVVAGLRRQISGYRLLQSSAPPGVGTGTTALKQSHWRGLFVSTTSTGSQARKCWPAGAGLLVTCANMNQLPTIGQSRITASPFAEKSSSGRLITSCWKEEGPHKE